MLFFGKVISFIYSNYINSYVIIVIDVIRKWILNGYIFFLLLKSLVFNM